MDLVKGGDTINTLEIEKELAEQYSYKPLPPEISEKYRKLFVENIPEWLRIDGDNKRELRTKLGEDFAYGYDRIVVGDYGAFIEIHPNQIKMHKIVIKSGQEYRVNDPRYSKNVKYHWYTTLDGSQIKIYYQVRGVPYADYKRNRYYVSVHEVE